MNSKSEQKAPLTRLQEVSLKRLQDFIHHETTAGLILVAAAAAAIAFYNIEYLRNYYDGMLQAIATVQRTQPGAGAHGALHRGLDVAIAQAAVRGSGSLWDEQLDGLTEEFAGRVAGEVLELEVHPHDRPGAVHDHETVGRRVADGVSRDADIGPIVLGL